VATFRFSVVRQARLHVGVRRRAAALGGSAMGIPHAAQAITTRLLRARVCAQPTPQVCRGRDRGVSKATRHTVQVN
jgi:hypothetical protein